MSKENTKQRQLRVLEDDLARRCDEIKRLRDKKRMTPEQGQEWNLLLDFWRHVEVARGAAEDHDFPDNDPLSATDQAVKSGIIDENKGAAIKSEFMARARAVTGLELTEKQVAGLYRVMRQFNPAQKL